MKANVGVARRLQEILALYEEQSGVGDVTPGYPRGGPKCTRPDRVGRADEIPADSIRTVRRAKLQEASSGVGIDPIFLVQLEI